MITMTDRRDQEWMLRGACRGAPAEWFIGESDGDDDPPYPSADALALCDRCPVQATCLEWAMAHDEYGVWGGTTRYQRRQLLRPRERLVCPGCASDMLVVEGQAELCLGCGISWMII
jgi:WhiB family redox-sensing transcriptional regulator